VLHRVSELADRPVAQQPAGAAGFINLVSLPEIIGEIAGSGPKSKKVIAEVDRLVATFGPELHILCETDVADLSRAGGSLLGEAVARLRRGEVIKEAGYDGEYGVIRLMRPRNSPVCVPVRPPSDFLFDLPATVPEPAGTGTPAADATGRSGNGVAGKGATAGNGVATTADASTDDAAAAAGSLTTGAPPANGRARSANGRPGGRITVGRPRPDQRAAARR
jgi:hypothetical protein